MKIRNPPHCFPDRVNSPLLKTYKKLQTFMFHSYFSVYAFVKFRLLTSSCTLHRRKFLTNVSVYIQNNLKRVILQIAVLNTFLHILSNLKQLDNPCQFYFHIHICKYGLTALNPFSFFHNSCII